MRTFGDFTRGYRDQTHAQDMNAGTPRKVEIAVCFDDDSDYWQVTGQRVRQAVPA